MDVGIQDNSTKNTEELLVTIGVNALQLCKDSTYCSSIYDLNKGDVYSKKKIFLRNLENSLLMKIDDHIIDEDTRLGVGIGYLSDSAQMDENGIIYLQMSLLNDPDCNFLKSNKAQEYLHTLMNLYMLHYITSYGLSVRDFKTCSDPREEAIYDFDKNDFSCLCKKGLYCSEDTPTGVSLLYIIVLGGIALIVLDIALRVYSITVTVKHQPPNQK